MHHKPWNATWTTFQSMSNTDTTWNRFSGNWLKDSTVQVMCVCVCVRACSRAGVQMWRPEVKFQCLP